MSSSQTENFDSIESGGELSNARSNTSSNSDSSQNVSETKHDSELLTPTSEALEAGKSDDMAEFEKLAESKRVEERSQPDSEYPDLEVEVEPQKDISLERAVEYEAFLRQTVDLNPAELSLNDDDRSLAQYDSALAIETESASTEELAEAVNTLIPLIVELLKYKIEDSQESILQGITPVIERIIEQRTQEEPQKMAAAIAKVLPSAISENIHLSPEEMGRAIAPEIALSIKEQIRLDKNAISEALGSEMGKAIKTQIEMEKDAMVDALYPVIGDTISKYMVEVVKEINRKVEKTLSPEGFKRKLKARLRGVSEAELILQESVGCHVQAIFLIDKDSGLIIQEVQQSGEQELNSEMIAGMLTAIRSFANDCIVSGSELDTIDYGNWQIHLEVAGYCYLAVVLKGEPNKSFINKIRRVFGDIVLNYGDAIEKFEGNIDTIPPKIKHDLERLIEPENELQEKPFSPKYSLFLLAFILAAILIPWGILSYRSQNAHHIERVTAIRLDAVPELSVYRLEPTVQQGTLIVEGRLPSAYLRDKAAAIGQNIARQNKIKFDNRITTVDVPVNPSLLAGEIARLTELFNRQPEVAIKANHQFSQLSIEGFVLDGNTQESIVESFTRIPGIKQIIININNELPKIAARIYFDSFSNQVDLANNSRQIESVISFLNRYPQLNLKLRAYSDGIGSKQINLQLNRQRCANLKEVLTARSIEPSRLADDCDTYRLSTRQSNQTVRLTRYIEFEPFIPPKDSP